MDNVMDLDIPVSFNTRVIVPYSYLDRVYHVLFYRKGIEGPFYVTDSPYSLENTLVSVGEIKLKANDAVVGNIFFSQSKVRCGGSFLLAYSGVFQDSLRTSIPKDFNMDLILKSKYLQVFNRRNRATLIVSPSLNSSIRQNLEI